MNLKPLAAIFFLGGIALIVAGANGNRPLIEDHIFS